jgi:hypothetical protein
MRKRFGPKTKSSSYARYGRVGPVERGAVVRYHAHSGWNKGIVLRLLPWNDFSRAYGRQALVWDAKSGTVREVSLGNMEIVGYVKRSPAEATAASREYRGTYRR